MEHLTAPKATMPESISLLSTSQIISGVSGDLLLAILHFHLYPQLQINPPRPFRRTAWTCGFFTSDTRVQPDFLLKDESFKSWVAKQLWLFNSSWLVTGSPIFRLLQNSFEHLLTYASGRKSISSPQKQLFLNEKYICVVAEVCMGSCWCE